jgi:hypothetical protein
MLSGLLRTVADVLLGDSERGRMARTLIRGFIVGDAELHAGVAQLPRPDRREVAHPSLPDISEGNLTNITGRVHKLPRTKEERHKADLAPSSDWPDLQQQLRATIQARGLTRAQAALEVGATPGTFIRWLGPSSHPPAPAARARLRAWVEDPPAADPLPVLASVPVDLPALVLTPGERELLSGYLSLGGDRRDLRLQFGASLDVLEKAAMGQTLAAEIVNNIRGGLANGAS